MECRQLLFDKEVIDRLDRNIANPRDRGDQFPNEFYGFIKKFEPAG
jgi:hypothetical protein